MGDVNMYNEVMMTDIYECGGKSGALIFVIMTYVVPLALV